MPVDAFFVEIEIGDPEGKRWTTIDALAGAGASACSVPGSVLRELGLSPNRQKRFRLAQGEPRSMGVGQAYIRIMGEEFITDFIFNDEGTIPLLGALALQSAHLVIDPREKQLIPSDGMLM